MLEVGPCDYEAELSPLSLQPAFLAAAASPAQVRKEKSVQLALLEEIEGATRPPISEAWASAEERYPVPAEGPLQP